jgi:hypothetical protein
LSLIPINPFGPPPQGLPYDVCAYCGTQGPTVPDHVLPRKLGGTFTVPSCVSCNNSKAGNWLPPTWERLIPLAIEAGDSYSKLVALSEADAKLLLSVAARALLMVERARRQMPDLHMDGKKLPGTRHANA